MKRPLPLILAFLLVLCAISFFTLFAFTDTATVSSKENRALASLKPLNTESWFSGEFAASLESFLCDHAYKRSDMISAASLIDTMIERRSEIKLVSHAATDMDGGASYNDEGTAPQASAAPGDTQAQGDTQKNTQDRLVLEDRILGVYYDAKDNLRYYTETASAFFAMFPDYVSKYAMISPSRIAFEPEPIAAYSDDQAEAIEYAYSLLDPLVTAVNVYTPLKENSARLDDLFFRTDHHWTHYGAFLGAQAFFTSAGKPLLSIENYTRMRGEDFLGYLYAQDSNPTLAKHRDELVYYLPNDGAVPMASVYNDDENGNEQQSTQAVIDPERSGYYTYLASSFSYAVIEGKANDAGCALLVSDSYGNALATWLCEGYSRVVVVDPRYYTAGKAGIMSLNAQYSFTDIILADFLGAIDTPYFPSRIKDLTE